MLETRKIVSTLNCIVKRRMCAQHKLPSSQWKIQTSKEECVPNTSCHQASGKYRRQRKNVCPTQAAIKPVKNTDVKGRTCAQHKLSSTQLKTQTSLLTLVVEIALNRRWFLVHRPLITKQTGDSGEF